MGEQLKSRIIEGKEFNYISFKLDGEDTEYPSDYYVKIMCDNGYKQAVKDENHGTLNRLIHSFVENNKVEAIEVTTYLGKYKTLLIAIEFIGNNDLEVLHYGDIMMLYMLKMFVDNNKHQLNIEEDSSYNQVKGGELYNLTSLDNVGVKYLGEELKFNQTIYIDDDNIMKRFKEELVKDELKELVNYYKVKGLKISIKGSNKSSEISLSLIKPNGNEVNEFERSYLQKYLSIGVEYTLLDYIDDMKMKGLKSYAHAINNSIDWEHKLSKRRGEDITKSELVSKIIKEDLKESSLEEYISSNVFREQGKAYKIKIGKYHLVNVLNAME